MYYFSWLDLIPYFLMAAIMFAIVVNKGNRKKKATLCFLLMFVFSAIRYGIGYDYYGYMKAVLHNVEDYTLDRFEPFSKILVEIGHETHFQLFFALASFITLYPVYRASLNLSINPAFSLFVYFLFPIYYLESFSIVRNAIAYSLVLYAYVLLYKKKKFGSVIMIIIAMMFHKSAAIGILIFPIYYLKIGIKWQLIAFIASFAFSNVATKLIGEYSQIIPYLNIVEHYAEYARSEGGSMKYILNFLCIYNFILWNKMIKFNPDNRRFLTLFTLGGCIWNLFLPIDSTLALRLSSYFLIFIIFLVPQYKYVFPKKDKHFVNYCSYSFFLVLFLSYFVINANAYLKRPERMSNIPYQTIFYYRDYSNYMY